MFIFIILTFITVINKVIPNQSYEISYKLHSTSNTYYESKSGIRMDDLDFVFKAYLRIEFFSALSSFCPTREQAHRFIPILSRIAGIVYPHKTVDVRAPIQSLPIPKGRPITYSVEL